MIFGDEIPAKNQDTLQKIAEYYLDRLVCPRMVDNRDRLHEYILNLARDYNVDGVIYQKMQFCECWGGENIYLEKELKEKHKYFVELSAICLKQILILLLLNCQ